MELINVCIWRDNIPEYSRALTKPIKGSVVILFL